MCCNVPFYQSKTRLISHKQSEVGSWLPRPIIYLVAISGIAFTEPGLVINSTGLGKCSRGGAVLACEPYRMEVENKQSMPRQHRPQIATDICGQQQQHPPVAPCSESAHGHGHSTAAPCSGTLPRHLHPSSKAYTAMDISQGHPSAAPAKRTQAPLPALTIWGRTDKRPWTNSVTPLKCGRLCLLSSVYLGW